MKPYVREFSNIYPVGYFDYPCNVIASETNYIETSHCRTVNEFTESAIAEMKKQNPGKSAVGMSTYTETIQRHYFVPNIGALPKTLIFNY